MSEVAIRVENLGKRYRIGGVQRHYPTLQQALADSLRATWRRLQRPGTHAADQDTIWALQDVSFEVQCGEVVGIIGRNGAGKSTLLKILSRITVPTRGNAELRGRVGSLLEVGTGFHHELTGRENIYLNGAILGMKRAEIERRFDEIVAFAEMEKFLDTPVKHYSSGMFVRLAFAVAAHLQTEILLVDEVLAVGDASFQKRCLNKMQDVGHEGRTVLFVSHNMQAISTLARRTILIDEGRIVHDGDTRSTLAVYRDLSHLVGGADYINPNKPAGVVRASVFTSEPNHIHRFGMPLTFEFEIVFQEKPVSGGFSFQVVDEQMRPIMHLWLLDSEKRWSRSGKVRLRCLVPRPRIYMGHYSLITHLSDRASLYDYERLDGICPFEVVMEGTPREYEWKPGACTYLEDAQWSVAD